MLGGHTTLFLMGVPTYVSVIRPQRLFNQPELLVGALLTNLVY